MALARTLYLEAGAETVLALHHDAEGHTARSTAVLIVPPWGWEEVASYRSRRGWAESLAAAGHPTLRFDLPSAGNSSGSPRDPGRLDAWVEAVTVAAGWLRGESGREGIAAIGLGLGGLLAREALARAASIDELVLWGAPASGRAFARETRAFSRMQPWDPAPVGEPGSLPEGWLEAGGFLLSAETLEALRGLAPELPEGASPRRALLLGRDGAGLDDSLRQSLEAAGTEVATDSGEGWARLVSHPERSALQEETVARVGAWLAEGESSAYAGAGEGTGRGAADRPRVSGAGEPPVSEILELKVDGRSVREAPLALDLPFGEAFAILAEPAEGAHGPCAVCLNAGAVRNVGPNRIWVEAARRWAAKGVRSVRVDLEGIGEAEGEAPARVAEFYRPKFVEQIGLVLDRLDGRGMGEGGYLLLGLCGGGYWAFQAALADRRVAGALLVNSGALAWRDELIAERDARKLGRASDPAWRRRLLRGEVSLAKLGQALRSLLLSLLRRLGRLGRRSRRSEVEADLDRLREAGVPMTMAFSNEEWVLEELEADGILGRLERWPDVELRRLPGSDHTLRPVEAQAAAGAVLDQGLDAALARASQSTGPRPPAQAGRQR